MDTYSKLFKERNPLSGIEPTKSTADEAEKKALSNKRISRRLFQSENRLSSTDLIIANNVLAHVPDINDFTSALKLLLKDGLIVIEFPHLLNLLKESNLTQYTTNTFLSLNSSY